MGRQSDKSSSQRPGKRERARIKKKRRCSMHTAIYVTSAGTDAPNLVWTEFKYGRKKARRVSAFIERDRREFHQSGNQYRESRVTNP